MNFIHNVIVVLHQMMQIQLHVMRLIMAGMEMMNVVNASVAKAYDGGREIHWREVLAGQKAYDATGEWMPEATLDAMRTGLVSIKGPLTTPVGGGIRSLNVALRQQLDLYACVRPVRWYAGTPSPVRDPRADDIINIPQNSQHH